MTELKLSDEPRPQTAWPHDLDVDVFLRTGWKPVPFHQFILKVHSRCNLTCDYCYMYRSPDQSWRQQPRQMGDDVVAQTAARIAQHIRRHHLTAVSVAFHGGEPLLVGPERLDFICTTLREAMPRGVELRLSVQTNGTLLDEPILSVMRRHHVHVGVSLDGPALAQNNHRTRPAGRGSHDLVAQGLERLRHPDTRHLFAGLLCVVDLYTDPVDVYEHLLRYDPPTIDFLLPHANWADPPRGKTAGAAPYGEWLVTAFDRWYSAAQPETSVRLFEMIIRGLLDRPHHVEYLGLAPVRLVVIEADGSIEQVDVLRSTYPGATATGLNVRHDPFDAALLVPGIVARQIGADALSDTCRRCELHRVCGGGYYPHRYHPATGFKNPSVYCEDLIRLIRHIRDRMAADLGQTPPMPLSA